MVIANMVKSTRDYRRKYIPECCQERRRRQQPGYRELPSAACDVDDGLSIYIVDEQISLTVAVFPTSVTYYGPRSEEKETLHLQ